MIVLDQYAIGVIIVLCIAIGISLIRFENRRRADLDIKVYEIYCNAYEEGFRKGESLKDQIKRM